MTLAALVTAAVFAVVAFHLNRQLGRARRERDSAGLELIRQTFIADAWRAIAEGKAAVAKVERGAM